MLEDLGDSGEAIPIPNVSTSSVPDIVPGVVFVEDLPLTITL
jgi:hypothetical protein